jgi:hypothetical protein
MPRLVPSVTADVVLSRTESSCHRKPNRRSSDGQRTVFRIPNCANIESYGFYLTRTDAHSAALMAALLVSGRRVL